MSPWIPHLARQVLASFGAMVLGVSGLLLWLDAIEARAQGLGLMAWACQVPGKVLLVGPVLAALAAGVVAVRWRRRGWVCALATVGIAPGRIALAMGLSAGLGLVGLVAMHEVVIGVLPSAPPPVGVWFTLANGFDGEGLLARVRGADGEQVHGVQLVTLRDGEVVGLASLDRAVYQTNRWHPPVANGWSVHGEPVAIPLPPMQAWRAAALVGPHSALGALKTTHNPAGRLWLIERLVMPLLGAWLAAGVARLGLRGGAVPMVVGVAAAGVWRLAEGGLLAMAVNGQLAAGLAAGVSVGLAVLGVVAGWRVRGD